MLCKKCKDTRKQKQWRKTLDFNSDSPKQVLELMHHLGLAVPKNRKTGGESTGAKYLERFSHKKGGEAFKWILECRKRSDLLGTFIWPTNTEGRVTTSYGFHPSTLRKSSRNVNLQNIPKRSDLAKEFRKMLVPAPGHVLLESDSSAIEAVLVGYFADDPDYIRAAKLGIHSFITSHWEKCPVSLNDPDEVVKKNLKAIKKAYPALYESAKRGGHGSNYLLSPYGLFDEYPDVFPSQKSAQTFQDFYFGLFPKVRAWHKSTLERAHRDGFLDNPYHYRHYFWHVLKYNSETKTFDLGDDAKRAVAFRPQSTASAIQTEYLLKLAEDEEMRSYLRLIIHDSIVCEVPISRLDYAASLLYKTMVMPLPELGGLSIGAEVQVGESLGDMYEWKPTDNGVSREVQVPIELLASPSEVRGAVL